MGRQKTHTYKKGTKRITEQKTFTIPSITGSKLSATTSTLQTDEISPTQIKTSPEKETQETSQLQQTQQTSDNSNNKLRLKTRLQLLSHSANLKY